MELAKEITVTLKSEDKTYKEKFLSYDHISLAYGDPQLDAMVKKAKEELKGNVEKVVVKITFEYC